jgi:uncharacterized glyoxalase superfamily protein PhnB
MPENPSPPISPYLLYEDLDAAVDFVVRAFGFTEVLRLRGAEGRSNHAEVELGGASVFMGAPGGGYRSPKSLGAATSSTYVYVEDVDAHFERARAEGAEIKVEPADQEYGDRRYFAEDLEGQQWFFATRIRNPSPEEWGAEEARPG